MKISIPDFRRSMIARITGLDLRLDELGNKLLDMKNQYVKIKNVDEEIFGNLFEARDE